MRRIGLTGRIWLSLGVFVRDPDTAVVADALEAIVNGIRVELVEHE